MVPPMTSPEDDASLADVVEAIHEQPLTDHQVLEEVKHLIFVAEEADRHRAEEHEELLDALKMHSEDLHSKLSNVLSMMEQLRDRLWQFEAAVTEREPSWPKH